MERSRRPDIDGDLLDPGGRIVAAKAKQPVSIWDALQSALDDAPKARPADSVTAQEFAEKAGISTSHAADKLAKMARVGKLRAVRYKTEFGAPGKCYVVASI